MAPVGYTVRVIVIGPEPGPGTTICFWPVSVSSNLYVWVEVQTAPMQEDDATNEYGLSWMSFIPPAEAAPPGTLGFGAIAGLGVAYIFPVAPGPTGGCGGA